MTYPNESGIELLSRSGVVETIQTPEPVTVGRRDQISAYPDDGFGLDGTRYHHGFYHCVSRDQSTKTGKHLPPKPNVRGDLNPHLQLADVTRGLKYLHNWPSVHADLKSVGLILCAFRCKLMVRRAIS